MAADLDTISDELLDREGLWYRHMLLGGPGPAPGKVEFVCVSERPELTAARIDEYAPGLVDLTVLPLRQLQTPGKPRVWRGPEPNEVTVSWEGDPQAVVDVLVDQHRIKVAIRELAKPSCTGSMMGEPTHQAVVRLKHAVDRSLVHVSEVTGSGWSRRYDSTLSPVLLPALGVSVLELRPTISIIEDDEFLMRFALDGVPSTPAAVALAAAFELTWEAAGHDEVTAALAVAGGEFPEIQVTQFGPHGAVYAASLANAVPNAVIAAARLVTADDV